MIASKVSCACTECPGTDAGKGAFGVSSITNYDHMLEAAAAGPVPVAIAARALLAARLASETEKPE